jgi:hypothetical protein
MSLPVPAWASRKLLANAVAAAERSVSQMSMPSSSMENATRSPAPGCAPLQAALRAEMIGPSGMRVRAMGFCGDWPCLAVRMISVRSASPRSRSACWNVPIC